MNSDKFNAMVVPFILGAALGGMVAMFYSSCQCPSSKEASSDKNSDDESEGYYVE